MALMGKIRGMYFRDKKSISEIARLTSLSRNTVKRWLKAAPGTQPKYRRGEAVTKLTPFAAALCADGFIQRSWAVSTCGI